jgi:formate dehydrogenase alpha subunit
VAGLAASFGSGAMTNPINDISNAACIFVLGSNTTEAHPVIALQIIKAVQNGAKLIVANPREIDLCRYADVWLRHRPGSDVSLLMGMMMRIILDEGLADTTFVLECCENFEAFRNSLDHFNLDEVEKVTGVAKDKITRAARLYATRKPGAIVYAMGITQHSHGVDNVLATANLAMLTGNIGKPSSGVNPLRGQNNVQGACDMGALPNVYSAYQRVDNPEVQNKFETAWECKLSGTPGITLTEIFGAIGKGQIKAVYLMGENPVISDADINHVTEALSQVEFLVAQDIFLTETAQLANVVLPACSFAEKDGTFTNTERRVQLVRKAIEPIGDAKPDWWIICQIAKKLGTNGFEFGNTSEIMAEINRVTPSYGGINFKRLETCGIHWPCPTIEHPGTPILHMTRFACGLGKFTPLKYKPPVELPDSGFPFILTTGRSLYHFHTGTMTRKVAGLNAVEPEGFAEINPTDAKSLGITNSQKIKIISRRGELITKAKLTEKSPPGVVYMNFHFAESAANILTNPALDPVAKIPEFKVCAVRIEGVK